MNDPGRLFPNIYLQNDNHLTVNTVRQSDDFFGADNDMRSLDGVEVDTSNISTTYPVPATLNTRIHKDHSLDNVIDDIQSGVQTRRMTVTTDEQEFISAVMKRRLMKIFILVSRLVAHGFTQEEGIDYDKVFAPIARIEAIRLFLAYVSFMGFLVYQIDVKSAFLITASIAKNATLKAGVKGKQNSGPTQPKKPKVLTPRMFAICTKYIPPPRRKNWVAPAPKPKKKQVTFREPLRPSYSTT
nr:copia protein [Tanacetum cinerariifolium]